MIFLGVFQAAALPLALDGGSGQTKVAADKFGKIVDYKNGLMCYD